MFSSSQSEELTMGEEGVVGSMPLAVATGVGGSWSHRIHWKLRDGRCYLLPGLLAPVLFRSEPQLSDSPLWRVPPYMPSGCFHDDFKQSRTESAEWPSQLPSEMFLWGKQSVKTGVFHSTRTHQGSQDNVVTLSSWEARHCVWTWVSLPAY